MADRTIHIKGDRKRRTHKQYVDVLLRNTFNGEYLPYAICWIDGRTFYIDEILSMKLVSRTPMGTWSWSRIYEIRLGEHVTDLIMEYYEDDKARGELSYTRWWVHARDCRVCGGTKKD